MYFIYSIEESEVSREKPGYIIFYVGIKTVLLKLFYCVFVTTKGCDHGMKPFNNYLSSSFSSEIYLFDEISICHNFQRFHSVGERLCYNMCLLT